MIYVTILLVLAGCVKNGKALQGSLDTNINFTVVSVDTVRLGIRIDGETVLNDWLAPAVPSRQVPIHYFNKQKRITIYNVADNSVQFDSLFNLDAGRLSITLFQKASGEPFIYIAPPATEPLPPAGFGKISFLYTFPDLPDTVKVVVENINGAGSYVATDSFQLKKGEFSPFFAGRSGAPRADVYLYTYGADRKRLASINRNEYSNMNVPFTIYAVGASNGYSNGMYNLVQQKLY